MGKDGESEERLIASPAHWFSGRFVVLERGRRVGDVLLGLPWRLSFGSFPIRVTVGGARYALRRRLGGIFTMDGGGEPVGRAEWNHGQLITTLDRRPFVLGMTLATACILYESEQPVGIRDAVGSVIIERRRVEADLPADLSLTSRLFILGIFLWLWSEMRD